jgi:hypothetical protein
LQGFFLLWPSLLAFSRPPMDRHPGEMKFCHWVRKLGNNIEEAARNDSR